MGNALPLYRAAVPVPAWPLRLRASVLLADAGKVPSGQPDWLAEDLNLYAYVVNNSIN
jgi:hypothetical protein